MNNIRIVLDLLCQGQNRLINLNSIMETSKCWIHTTVMLMEWMSVTRSNLHNVMEIRIQSVNRISINQEAPKDSPRFCGQPKDAPVRPLITLCGRMSPNSNPPHSKHAVLLAPARSLLLLIQEKITIIIVKIKMASGVTRTAAIQ